MSRDQEERGDQAGRQGNRGSSERKRQREGDRERETERRYTKLCSTAVANPLLLQLSPSSKIYCQGENKRRSFVGFQSLRNYSTRK